MDFKELAEKRRSINFFDPQQKVEESLLTELIETAAMTPSSFNLQPWNLLTLTSFEDRQKLRPLAWDQPKVTEAPVILVVLADKDGWREGHPTVEKNWLEMLSSGAMKQEQREWFLDAANSLYNWNPDANLAFAAKNSGFFAISLMYAATSLGLASHPMDGFDHEGVRNAFNIPDNYWITMLLAVGYPSPDIELHPAKWRKTREEIEVSF